MDQRPGPASLLFKLSKLSLIEGKERGFAGGETSKDEANPAANPTILSGDIGSLGDNTDNSYHVVLIDDGDDATFWNVFIDGVTITGGYADLSTDNNYLGAGIFNFENLTLRQVSVSNNFAQGQGGGIELRLGTCRIEDSLISGNEANGRNDFGDISADGRYVVFTSNAPNLVPNDTNGWDDIFLHDRQLGTTERVNVSTAGNQTTFWSGEPSVSGNGRYVVFMSNDDQLVPNDFKMIFRSHTMINTQEFKIGFICFYNS